MKAATGTPPWALSFADLLILLLAFFVMLHAQSGHQAQIMNGIKQALGGPVVNRAETHDIDPRSMFQPDEAVLKPQARAALQTLGRHAVAVRAKVRIESIGTDRSTSRFDGWELAAARTAAIGRAVKAGGLADGRITISIPEMTSAGRQDKQRIAIEIVPGT